MKVSPFHERWLLLGIALALLVGAGIIYAFPPGSWAFYPRCVLHSLTGLNCPGCGILRATHQALHGNLGAALRLNPLLFLLVPVGLWLMADYGARVFWRRSLPHPFTHPAWPWVVAVLVIAFGLGRNLPWFAVR